MNLANSLGGKYNLNFRWSLNYHAVIDFLQFVSGGSAFPLNTVISVVTHSALLTRCRTNYNNHSMADVCRDIGRVFGLACGFVGNLVIALRFPWILMKRMSNRHRPPAFHTLEVGDGDEGGLVTRWLIDCSCHRSSVNERGAHRVIGLCNKCFQNRKRYIITHD